MAAIAFKFEGRRITARSGQSLAAALTEAGYRDFRYTSGGDYRGLFCGIGVCQDCLLTVDGVPNRRACMTPATPGTDVNRQVARPDMAAAAHKKSAAPVRRIDPDVLVIGGGAGGLSAAMAARRTGASVALIEERSIPGGQYYKQATEGHPLDARQAEGAALVAAARESGAEIITGAQVWGAFDGPLFLAEYQGSALVARPKTAIVATGAYERPLIVPGWTLPGVMTTGAAQTLWRSYRTLPGRRVAVCGSGPLNLQVALELADGGVEIAIVAESARTPFTRPVTSLAMIRADPRLTWQGISMYRGLRGRGVPVENSTELVRIDRARDGLAAIFRSRSGKESTFDVDVLCMNAGFEPQNEMLRLLGADMRYDAEFGHLRTVRSENMETSVPGLFAVGDCAGLGGAPAARVEGHIAGRAAAAAAGFGDANDISAYQRELRRHRRFQSLLWRLHDIAVKDIENVSDEVLICRCEGITAGRIRESIAQQPGHLGTLKRSTRAGMGRCQGRYCAPVLARTIANQSGQDLGDTSFFAPRVPIKPVSIASIIAAKEAIEELDAISTT
jgi:D-hydroxyproline dehydrogenase subunit alpha